jgi:hypothetical protein
MRSVVRRMMALYLMCDSIGRNGKEKPWGLTVKLFEGTLVVVKPWCRGVVCDT